MIKDQEASGINSRRIAKSVEQAIPWFTSLMQLPVLSLTAALGLLLIAMANTGSRTGHNGSALLYWVGLLLLFIPISTRLLMANVPRGERISLVVILGMGFYLVKLFYSPLEFKFPDELQHWRTINDMLQTGHLFGNNLSLPISPFYPGLEIVTDAFIQLSKLPIFEAGVIVIAVARLILTLSLYFAYERISGSARIAGVASVIYMVNPHYLFLNSFFIYQTLAIALTAFALYVMAKGDYAHPREKIVYKILFILAFSAVVVTHHVTSYFLMFLLTLWLIASALTSRHHTRSTLAPWIWLFGLLEILTWITLVATDTVYYFRDAFEGFVNDISNLINGQENLNQVFQAPSGPVIERIINLGVVGLIALFLLPSLWYAWRRYRRNPLALMLILGALTYYGSILIRVISSQGAEFAGRSWSFVFLMVAFVMAVGFRETWKNWLQKSKLYIAVPAFLALMMVGGIIGGWPPAWERQPGGYQVGGFESSIEPQGVADAFWAAGYLGPSNRISSDFVNYTLMGTYGQQDPARGLYRIFYSPDMGPDPKDIKDIADIKDIQRYSVEYLVVDQRMSRYLPASGRYFDTIDPKSYRYTKPIDLAALTKFDHWDKAYRIFDSGDIVIYDIKEFTVGH